jgi:glyoxylase-like metal-dependent hydrolase (beta-lactamase superfamily II)
MEKTRRVFMKTIGEAALGAGLLLASGYKIAQAGPKTEMPVYTATPSIIIPLPLWTVEAPVQGIFTCLVDIGKLTKVAGYVWYIKGQEQNILVDAGDKAADMQAHGFPAVPYRAGAEPDADPITPELAKHGLTPQNIDIVILTQLHFDHCALMNLFTNAKFVVQRKEFQSALYHPPTAQKPFYNKKFFEHKDFHVIEGDMVKEASNAAMILSKCSFCNRCLMAVATKPLRCYNLG